MMTYWRLAASVALSVFAVVATLLSMAVAGAAPVVAHRAERFAASSRAALLFRMRVLPASVAALVAFGIALPVFLWFEPRDTGETIARTLVVAGAAGAALLARGAWWAVRAWRATRALTRDWLRRGRLVDVDAPMPVFAIGGSFPTVAVVGFTRPVLFIAERVLRECTPAEVRAMISHECAHVTARDNWRRLAIRACPDLLGRRGSPLERAWFAAIEEAADAAAAAIHPTLAIDLAQALIRVARLAPVPSLPQSVSAFYRGGSIEARVRRLVDPPSASESMRPLGGLLMCTLAMALTAAVILAAPAVHQFMEAAIRRLP